jgi:hypothetical protein
MDDDLAGGAGRAVPRWLRGVGGLALAGLVALGGWQGRHATPTRPPPVVGDQAAPTDPPVDFRALPAGGHTGLRLLVGGHTVTELDVDSGAARQVAGIPAATLGYRLTLADGGVVIAQEEPDCPDCRPPAYVLGGPGPGVPRLDGYDGVAPAARPDRLWTYRLPPGQDRAGSVRLVDLAGRPVGPAYRLPAGLSVRRGTVAGLLVARCCGPNYALWDPATGRTLRTFGQVLAASATRLAWVELACVLDCPVVVADLAPGGTDLRVAVHGDGLSRFEPPGDGVVQGGAFSPDGRTLALLVPHRASRGSTGPTQEVYLVTDRLIVQVGASTVAAGIMPVLMWAGSRLVVAVPGDGAGSPRLSVATATVGRPELSRAGAALAGLSVAVPP